MSANCKNFVNSNWLSLLPAAPQIFLGDANEENRKIYLNKITASDPNRSRDPCHSAFSALNLIKPDAATNQKFAKLLGTNSARIFRPASISNLSPTSSGT